MSHKKLNIEFNYSLTPEWQEQIVKSMDAKIVNNKTLTFPEPVASGYSFFLQIAPGLSVSLLDFVFHIPVTFIRKPNDGNHYIIYYDMADEITTHFIEGKINETSYHAQLGMAFIDSKIKNVITPQLEVRSCHLRLIVDKIFLKSLADNGDPGELTDLLFDGSKNTIFFYRHIDSKSKLLLDKIKDKDINDPIFELQLKGVVFHLLYHLLARTECDRPIINKLSERDIENILNTSTYLLDNLTSDFPGPSFLSGMARMSTTKYNILFKKILKVSPKSFFLKEKLLLSRSLLASGNFNSVSEIAYELGYSKANYFSTVYKQTFGVLPVCDLIKKNNRIPKLEPY